MNQRGAWLALMLGCAACSDMSLSARKGDSEGACDVAGVSVALEVQPATLTRGDAETVWVRWLVREALTEPVAATFTSESEPVVSWVVSLARGPDEGDLLVYQGASTSPLGLGAPAGTLQVLASSTLASGCYLTPARAVTSAELQ